jgi:hypothetical protein
VDRRAFAALSMDSETIVVDFMPIHITHRDKKSASTQHADVSWVMADVKIVSMASYTDRRQVLRRREKGPSP